MANNQPMGMFNPNQQGQIPVAVNIDLQFIFKCIKNIVRFPMEVTRKEEGSDELYPCMTCNPSIEPTYYSEDISLDEILSDKGKKLGIIQTSISFELLFQLAGQVGGSQQMFNDMLCKGIEQTPDSNDTIVPARDNLTETLREVSSNPLSLNVSILVGCETCHSSYLYCGVFSPTIEQIEELMNSINKQIERAMLANGISMPKQTASGIILPK